MNKISTDKLSFCISVDAGKGLFISLYNNMIRFFDRDLNLISDAAVVFPFFEDRMKPRYSSLLESPVLYQCVVINSSYFMLVYDQLYMFQDGVLSHELDLSQKLDLDISPWSVGRLYEYNNYLHLIGTRFLYKFNPDDYSFSQHQLDCDLCFQNNNVYLKWSIGSHFIFHNNTMEEKRIETEFDDLKFCSNYQVLVQSKSEALLFDLTECSYKKVSGDEITRLLRLELGTNGVQLNGTVIKQNNKNKTELWKMQKIIEYQETVVNKQLKKMEETLGRKIQNIENLITNALVQLLQGRGIE
ncbi:Hypothetical_protein [Hexamita inflata]|uniref:Hypothetical_protein n=1 Tax=Hexamita inflata TaxID=28002 RepID=A0AA86QRI6_9EUKA|nr:Hypothetical protein HINF_LOCUS41773 [Hexamita inflata]CAI9963285.1 Hypothetical protein HINF_LOCUS50930 [Hexamita inflata]